MSLNSLKNIVEEKNILYFVNEISKIQEELEGFLANKNNSIKDLENEFLSKVLNILELSNNIELNRKRLNNSEYSLKVLKRYESMYLKSNDIKNVDELLDIYLSRIIDILSIEPILLDFDIYSPKQSTQIKKGDGKYEKNTNTVDKLKVLLRTLFDNGITLSNLKIFQEKLHTRKLRQIPYNIIQISENNIQKTIVISDSLGDATYIYDGIIDIEKFKYSKKGELIDGIPANRVIYGSKYSHNLDHYLFKNNNNSSFTHTNSGNNKKISEDDLNEVIMIAEWRKFIISKKEQLESEALIYELNGVWYFGDMKGSKNWLYLRSFPNSTFNKKNSIGNHNGIIENPKGLKKLFQTLGLIVATEQQELLRWKSILESYKERLEKEANIYEIDGIWYFGNAKGNLHWKYLINFPNCEFNRKNNVGAKKGAVKSVKELINLFKSLGLRIATEQEEKNRWREIIFTFKEKLEKDSNIIENNGVWDLSNAKGANTWKYLINFPSAEYNKNNGIGNNDGIIVNIFQLVGMFNTMGLNTIYNKN